MGEYNRADLISRREDEEKRPAEKGRDSIRKRDVKTPLEKSFTTSSGPKLCGIAGQFLIERPEKAETQLQQFKMQYLCGVADFNYAQMLCYANS